MSQVHVNALRAGLLARIASLLGLGQRDKQPLLSCPDRMAALDDPQTRAALKHLPPHLLSDIGVRNVNRHSDRYDLPDGEALRRHLW